MADSISYDPERKIWKTVKYPYAEYVNQTIGEAYLKTVKSTESNKVLEKYYDNGTQKTVNDIFKESITVAVNLKKMGVQQGDILLLYSMLNTKISGIVLGSFLMGVAVNFFETKFEPEHIEYTLQLISPTVLLYEEKYKQQALIAQNNQNICNPKYFLSLDGQNSSEMVDQTLLKPISKVELDAFVLPKLGNPNELLALLMLTSGSTGLPKAVAISHSLLLHGVITFWSEPHKPLSIISDSVLFSFSPLRWISQICLILQSVLLGVKRICATEYPSGPYGREIVRKERITHFFSAPSVFEDILLSTDQTDEDALSSVRFILLGGDYVTQALANLAQQNAPKAKLMQCYGMTELSGCITSSDRLNGGYLIPGIELQILDDNFNPVGPNTHGQLCVRTPLNFLGYYKSDKNDSYSGNAFFNTGDYGFVDDTNVLHIVARYKDLIRAGNVILIPNNISLMINKFSFIKSSILIGYRKSTGATTDSAALFIIPNDNVKTSYMTIKADVRNYLQRKLSPDIYKIICDINIMDSKYPLTSCGKIDKIALARLIKPSSGI